MAKGFRNTSSEELFKQLTEMVSVFDDFTLHIEWTTKDVSKYQELVSMFPCADIGYRRHKWVKKAIKVEITKSIKNVMKKRRAELFGDVYRKFTAILNWKPKIIERWLDTYISISEWN